jgi:hypothetical protein
MRPKLLLDCADDCEDSELEITELTLDRTSGIAALEDRGDALLDGAELEDSGSGAGEEALERESSGAP